MPRGVKGSIYVLWPSSDFSLVLDTFPCHDPLAFGQRQMLSLSDCFMTFKGFKAFNLFLPSQTFDLRYLLSWALHGVKQDEKSSATGRCCLSWSSPAGLFPTVAGHTGAM